MLRLTEIRLPLDHGPDALSAAICERLGIKPDQITGFQIARRAHDARRKSAILMVYSVDVAVKDEAAVLARCSGDIRVRPAPDQAYHFTAKATGREACRPIIIGTGPCGLFAGLILAQMGFRPIILDRGKVVRERTKDTWGLWRGKVLNPESNVQYGEGGAGTFSDGKLYSQIKDPRHLGRKVLTEFVKAGAPPEILTEAHPHIGTFRLVSMVESLRGSIEALGGEYRFQSKVTDLLIEHPQSLIDKARFGTCAKHPDLGAADYKLSHACANGRTVYSFCMCPGGTVVAAASEPGRLVTNGMSQYSRKERNANAGMVVDVTPEKDFPGHPLAGIALQRHWEEQAFKAGGSDYTAPGQRLGDFLAGRPSTQLGQVAPSYQPGVKPTDLSACLPEFAIAAMREALPVFGRQIPGFADPDAVLTGVETRTSSPIRITRDKTFQSLNTPGLYPAGEGAGYAGGILSAAVDGIKVAEAVAAAMVGAAGRCGV